MYPLDFMNAILISPNKKKKVIACFDGDNKIEIYKDKTEQIWIATVNLEDMVVDFYWSKFSPVKPNVKLYKLIIPAVNETFYRFKLIKIEWEN